MLSPRSLFALLDIFGVTVTAAGDLGNATANGRVHQGKVGVLMHVAALFPLLYPHGISDLLHGCYMGAQPQPNSAQRIVPLPISLSLDACFYR